ncbi:MAG: gliding motility-associated ABC transporter substrate-binding protein GldG [Flavisolibacter sp.]|nr:gliding motility-associated ABC transporter substrate-binding protein GldG [Flavisolibacter sp.]
MKKRNKQTIFIVGAIAVLVIIYFLAAQLHYRFDLTQEKRYSLNKATKRLAQNLEQPVQVDVFLKGDYPAGFRKLAQTTQEFLQTLREYNTSKINYRFIAPEDEMPGTNKTYGDSLVNRGISPINLTVQVKSGQENKLVFPVAIVHSNDHEAVVDLYAGGKRLITPAELNNAEALMEYRFAKALDELSRTTKPFIAYSTGNGEPTGPETYSLQQTLQNDYQLFTFDLNKQRFIPDTFKVLLIVKPSVSFTEPEKRKIDQYVMHGGKLLWFIDGLHAEQDSLRFKTETVAYDRNLNLDDLLFRYGVRINPDLIMDLQSDFMPFVVGGSAANPQYEFLHWNYYPLFESKENNPITKNLGLVAGRFVNSMDTVGADGIRKMILLSSSNNARTIKTPALISLNENRNMPEDAAFRQKNIPAAVLSEGTFQSLYKARTPRAVIDTMAAEGYSYREVSDHNKIIIVSDGDIVLNDVSSQQGPLPMGMNLYTAGTQYEYQFANRDFLLNSLEYLTSRPEIIQTRNKEIVLRLLDTKKVAEQRTLWQLINIALPIALVILIGIIYQQVRKHSFSL